jgi:hypothetical protein
MVSVTPGRRTGVRQRRQAVMMMTGGVNHADLRGFATPSSRGKDVQHNRIRASAGEIGESVFPCIPDSRLVAVRREGLREHQSHVLVVLDQEKLHCSPILCGIPSQKE